MKLPRAPKKALALADALAEEIAGGRWRPGEWLPSRADLADELDASPGTIAASLAILAERGGVLLVAERGAQVPGGPSARPVVTRVANDHTREVGGWRGFNVAAAEAGQEAYVEPAVAEVEASSQVATWLGVPVGTRVVERSRIQGLVLEGEHVPVQLSWTWIAPSVLEVLPVLAGPDTGPGGMGSRFAEVGLRIRYEDTVAARSSVDGEAARLGMPAGGAVLDVWRRAYDQDDRIVEVTRRVIRSELQPLVYRYP